MAALFLKRPDRKAIGGCMTLLLLAVCCALLLTALECANMFLDYNAPLTWQLLDVPLVEWTNGTFDCVDQI